MKTPIRAFALLAFAAVTVQAADWPFFRGPNRNGAAEVEFTPAEDPEILWKTNLGREGERRGAPVIANGKVYVHGGSAMNEGRIDHRFVQLFCLDAETGDEIWASEIITRTDTAPTVDVARKRVYSFDDNRVVRCFDAETGEVIWTSEQLPDSTHRRGWGHTGSPVLWEDLILLNVGYGAALKQENGEVVWRYDGFSGMATPVLFSRGGKTAVAIFCGDKLVAREARSGEELFSIPWETSHGVNAADPVIFDDGKRIFLSSDYGLGRALYDISGNEPKELWYYTQEQDHGGHSWFSASYFDGNLYAMTRGGLACVDLSDGSLKWRIGDRGYLLKLGANFVLTNSQGEMSVGNLNPDEPFTPTIRAQIAGGETWNVAAYAEGKLYSRNKTSDVFCARISD